MALTTTPRSRVYLLGCDATTNALEKACVQRFLTGLAPRAFRRPLLDGELSRFMGHWQAVRAEVDLRNSVRALIELVLQSPQFLYRTEFLGGPGATQYETASALSYLLWGAPPDAELTAAAAAGSLSSPDQLRSQARRLLAAPAAREAMLHFFRQWWAYGAVGEVDRDRNIFPEFDRDVASLFLAETDAFAEHVAFDATAEFKALFTASYSFRNQRLSAFLGEPGEGTAMARVELDPLQRSGILTQASVLALNSTPTHSSPIFRGRFVREHLLCGSLPPPPVGVPELPEIGPNATVREIHELHAKAPQCQGCHLLVDPIGFGLEHFDAAGAWRDTYENGRAVDSKGEVVDGGDASGTFDGAIELGRMLADSQLVRECAAMQMAWFALGRDLDNSDGCTIAKLSWALREAGGGRFEDMLLEMVTNPALVGKGAN